MPLMIGLVLQAPGRENVSTDSSTRVANVEESSSFSYGGWWKLRGRCGGCGGRGTGSVI